MTVATPQEVLKKERREFLEDFIERHPEMAAQGEENLDELLSDLEGANKHPHLRLDGDV